MAEKKKLRTLGDALLSGRWEYAERTRERGYISRKVHEMSQPLRIAHGAREGQVYVLLPCMDSTRYCWRQYLRPRKVRTNQAEKERE